MLKGVSKAPRREVHMQANLELILSVPGPEKPFVNSYDSGEECSIQHWMELCKLLDENDVPEFEVSLEHTVSEV